MRSWWGPCPSRPFKVNWRCNVEHYWVEAVPRDAAGKLHAKLGYSDEAITGLGCSPPTGASGPGEAAAAGTKDKLLASNDTGLRSVEQGTGRYPPITTANVTAIAGKDYKKRHIPKESPHVFWARAECGLVLPSIGGF